MHSNLLLHFGIASEAVFHEQFKVYDRVSCLAVWRVILVVYCKLLSHLFCSLLTKTWFAVWNLMLCSRLFHGSLERTRINV